MPEAGGRASPDFDFAASAADAGVVYVDTSIEIVASKESRAACTFLRFGDIP
jgi:hypothetical protein